MTQSEVLFYHLYSSNQHYINQLRERAGRKYGLDLECHVFLKFIMSRQEPLVGAY